MSGKVEQAFPGGVTINYPWRNGSEGRLAQAFSSPRATRIVPASDCRWSTLWKHSRTEITAEIHCLDLSGRLFQD